MAYFLWCFWRTNLWWQFTFLPNKNQTVTSHAIPRVFSPTQQPYINQPMDSTYLLTQKNATSLKMSWKTRRDPSRYSTGEKQRKKFRNENEKNADTSLLTSVCSAKMLDNCWDGAMEQHLHAYFSDGRYLPSSTNRHFPHLWKDRHKTTALPSLSWKVLKTKRSWVPVGSVKCWTFDFSGLFK